jgi:hypothetical protein
VLRTREHAPTPSPSIVFTFGLTIKSTKELGGVLMFVTKKKNEKCGFKKNVKIKILKKIK